MKISCPASTPRLKNSRAVGIDFYVDFEFHNRLLQKVIETLFHEAVRRMVTGFETRARALYGAPGDTLSDAHRR